MLHNLLTFTISLGDTLIATLPMTLALAAIFSVLGCFWACNPGRPWWRRQELVTDVVYWFFVPLLAKFLRIGVLILGASVLFDIHGPEQLAAFYDHGHGPLASLPFAGQMLIYLVVSDFLLYWSHRVFHGGSFWKYHAIHHAPEELDWVSAARLHPVNLLLGTIAVDAGMLIAGISPDVLVWLAPFTTFHSAFVHANLNWSLGPLRFVIATPVFHRWHHTSLNVGGNTNFASTFPVWDLLFNSFRMPAGELPSNYGADDPTMPTSFPEQLAYPFKSRPR